MVASPELNALTAPAGARTKGGPRFSVVVPAYNEAALLGGCLESLARQDFAGDYEIIVVDNNSTDATAEIARSFGVQVVREEHPGTCWARQRGTQEACGEIVVSADADTTYGPGWLSRIDRAFRKDPACVAVAGPCHFVDAPLWGRVYAWLLFRIVNLISLVTGRILYVTATNLAFRRDAWPGYDTRSTQGGDELDLLRRLRARGNVAFDLGNPSFTSSRRLYRGLLYNVFVTFLYYYALGYGLNRLLGRTVVGTAPPFRAGAQPAIRARRAQRILIASVCLALFLVVGTITVHMVDPR